MPKSSRQRKPPPLEDNRQLADDRTELLEVIREIVEQEIEEKLKEYFDNNIQQ